MTITYGSRVELATGQIATVVSPFHAGIRSFRRRRELKEREATDWYLVRFDGDAAALGAYLGAPL